MKFSRIHTAAQNLQLSYTNADIAEKLVRTATTTPAPVPTTKKSTFFGGIRNLFKGKESSATDVVDTTPPPPPTPAPIAGSKMIGALIVPSSTAKPAVAPVAAVSTTSTTSTTTTSTTTTTTTPKPPTQAVPAGGSTTTTVRTPAVTFGPSPRDPLHDFESYASITLTTKKPKIKEDFPALPAPRRPVQPAAAVTPAAAPAVPNAWGNGVSFVTTARPVVPGASTTTVPSTTTGSPANEATDAELEALSEVLYGKEISLLPLVTLNYQTRTQSSGSLDEAPLP